MDKLSNTVRGEFSRFAPQGSLMEVVDRWPDAVGAAIARSAWPARIGRDGTLVVNTADSIWAFELAQKGPEIATRLGVLAIRFVPGPIALETPPRELRETPAPSAEQIREATEIAASIDDENLRKSIERAVSLSLARGPVDRPV